MGKVTILEETTKDPITKMGEVAGCVGEVRQVIQLLIIREGRKSCYPIMAELRNLPTWRWY